MAAAAAVIAGLTDLQTADFSHGQAAVKVSNFSDVIGS